MKSGRGKEEEGRQDDRHAGERELGLCRGSRERQPLFARRSVLHSRTLHPYRNAADEQARCAFDAW